MTSAKSGDSNSDGLSDPFASSSSGSEDPPTNVDDTNLFASNGDTSDAESYRGPAPSLPSIDSEGRPIGDDETKEEVEEEGKGKEKEKKTRKRKDGPNLPGMAWHI